MGASASAPAPACPPRGGSRFCHFEDERAQTALGDDDGGLGIAAVVVRVEA